MCDQVSPVLCVDVCPVPDFAFPVPRRRQFNDTWLADVHCWSFRNVEILIYSMIDEATCFHVTHVLRDQTPHSLFEGIMQAWITSAGAPRLLSVDPHLSFLARSFLEQLCAQGTIVLVGAAEAAWTRGLVERHASCVGALAEKTVQDGAPDDMCAQSVLDKATGAKNIMSRTRGYNYPAQWVLATQPRVPGSLMIHDANADHVPHKDVPDSQDDEFAPSVRVRHAARRVCIHVDTDHRLRKAAAAVSRPNRLTLEPGDLGTLNCLDKNQLVSFLC